MSEIRVDTISEKTSANGVTIDGVLIKDSKIGIGTTSPGAILEVVGPGARPSSLAEVDTASTAKFTSDASNADSLYIAEGDSGALIQVNDGASNSSTAKDLQLQPFGGNVGIGTVDPGATLHVDASAGGVIRVSRNSSSTSNFMALEADGTNGTVKAIQELIISAGGSEAARFTSGGLAIGGTGAANTLDDYEEGTWTAAIKDQSNNAVTMGDAAGSYTKVGRLVFIQGYFRVNGLGSASGNVRLTGLPFAIANNNNAYASASVGYAANLNNAAVSVMTGYTAINTSDIFLQNWDATHSTSHLQASELSLDGEFILSCTYRTA